jgi:probable phosphoglycerate mutase
LTYAPREVQVYSDSKLIVEQMRGWIRVRSAQLRRLHRQARELAERFERVTFTHVPRERNQLADAIADEAVNGYKADKRIEPSTDGKRTRFAG